MLRQLTRLSCIKIYSGRRLSDAKSASNLKKVPIKKFKRNE
jgi:hypothetical protein